MTDQQKQAERSNSRLRGEFIPDDEPDVPPSSYAKPERSYSREGLNLTGLWSVMFNAASALGHCADGEDDPMHRSRINQARGELLGASEVIAAINKAEGYRSPSNSPDSNPVPVPEGVARDWVDDLRDAKLREYKVPEPEVGEVAKLIGSYLDVEASARRIVAERES